MPAFQRYVGIDYSGAQVPTVSLSRLRIYMADRLTAPVEVQPPPSPRRHWTRQEIAQWLEKRLLEDTPTLIGIDHAFSFPLRYFQKYRLPIDWTTFLEDFRHHWPTDERIYVDFVRDGLDGNGAARCGSAKWRRLTEMRTRTAKSVFHFDVPGSVAKSTHAGLPWLSYLRRRIPERVHFWPFDGWKISRGRSVLVEVYPKLWSGIFAREGRNPHQQDAYSIAAWMRQADSDGSLARCFEPEISEEEREVGRIEGWILGVA